MAVHAAVHRHGPTAAVAGHHEAGNGVRRRDQQNTEDEQEGGRSVGHNTSPRKSLLRRDQGGDECHPGDAHDTEGEQGCHQRPATADAPRAVPGAHLQRAGQAAAPGAEQEAERAAALGQTNVLERGELVDGREQERAARKPPTSVIPSEGGAQQTSGASRDTIGEQAGGDPSQQVAAREQQRRDRSAAFRHPRIESDRRRDRREHHRGHHHDPDSEKPAERSEVGTGAAVHPTHALDRPPPGDSGERRTTRQSGRVGRARRQKPLRVLRRSTVARRGSDERRRAHAYAAQENCDDEKPALPSYSMPKALIRERVALEIVSSEPAGWKIPTRRAGSPDSTPKGTTSSISKSITSPILTLWRQTLLANLNHRAHHAEAFRHERREHFHRSTELAAEHRAELLGLHVGSGCVDEDAETPVPVAHHLGRVRRSQRRSARSTSVPSTSPSVTLKTSVTRQRS